MKTPYYVINEADLESSLNGFRSALRCKCNSFIPSYSVKTNSLPYILKKAKEFGYFAEVVSDDEYHLALCCGFDRGQIVFNGPFKSQTLFLEAIEAGSIVNIETFRELEWLSLLSPENVYKVGLRMNINISAISPADENHVDDDSRFGFSCESGDFDKALAVLRSLSHVQLSRIHIHRTSRTRSVMFYHNLLDYALSELNYRGLKIDTIDIGGGYFGQMPAKPTYMEYADAIAGALKKHHFENATVIIEPGNAIVASCLTFETSVIDVKNHDNTHYVTIDGSRIDIDPLFRKNDYFKHITHQGSGKVSEVPRQVICGCTCLEFDRLMELKDQRLLQVGDRIRFNRVGAYTMTLTPLFIRYWPDVYVDDGHEIKLVRKKFDAERLI